MRRVGCLALCFVIAGMVALTGLGDEDEALYLGGVRLVDLQQNDGGWDWPLDDGDPDDASPLNTLGPIAMGLAQAYWDAGDASFAAALVDAGGLLLSKTTNFSPSDGYLAVILDSIFGGSTYRDHVLTNFYIPLSNGTYDKSDGGVLYSTADYVQLIRDARAAQGIGNLAAWDVAMGLVGAAACGADIAPWVAGTKAEIDELTSAGYYDVIGLAGAVYGLAFVGEDYDPIAGEHAAAASLADLAAILAGYQIPGGTGGFTWNANFLLPGNLDETVQETAYAVLALNQFDRMGFADIIQLAVDWLIAFQEPTGGWKNWELGGENNEITGEALWAIQTLYLNDVWVSPTGSDTGFGYGAIPFATIGHAVDVAGGLGAVIHVGAGTYNESIWIAPGSVTTIQGDGWATTTLEGVLSATDKGARHTGSETVISLSGMTFDGMGQYAAKISKYEEAPLDLEISDSRFVGTYGAMWICRNSYASRDPVTGLGAVRIYNNLFESRTGLCMSNSQGYDIVGNVFDLATDPVKGSEAAYVGSGCSGGSLIRGDHLFQWNDITGSGGGWAALDFAYYLNPAGAVNLANRVLLNNFWDNDIAIHYQMWEPAITAVGDQIHFNSFDGNAMGILVDGPYAAPIQINAVLNWWGSDSGPSGVGPGTGDGVSDNVIYSPWLGVDPDADPGTVGVQLLSPLVFIVDDVGPEPADGYLGTALIASNGLLGADTIQVNHGTYDVTEPITDPVTMVSEVGSASNTLLNGPIAIDVPDVLLGRWNQGFTINGPITVGAGVDASTVHINWNDIYGLVTNNGLDTLDATFNYWGEDGPDTVGSVNIFPLLPEGSDTIIAYMEDFELNALQAIDFSHLLDELNKAKRALVGIDLMDRFGLTLEQALEIIDEYGWMHVRNALRRCGDDFDRFLVLLVGYGIGGPAGGGGSFLGGGAAGTLGISSFCVGCEIPLMLELIHPVTGDVVDDATVSFTVCRTLDDGTIEIVMYGVVPFDPSVGGYAVNVETDTLEPGFYDIYLGSDDGRHQHFQVEIFE